MVEVVMPQLGETVTEGTVTRWAKQVGERVERDEVLFEVSTDKVDTEVPAPASGTLAEIRVAEGETVPVGTVLAVIAEGAEVPSAPSASDGAGASTPELATPSATTAAAPAAAAPPAGASPAARPPAAAAPPAGASPAAVGPMAPPAPAVAPPAASAPATAPPASGAARPAFGAAPPAPPTIASPPPGAGVEVGVAASVQGAGNGVGSPQVGEPLSGVLGAGVTTQQPFADRGVLPSRAVDPVTSSRLLSPVVRKLIDEHGLDPRQIPGTGLGGRITRADVLGYIDRLRREGQMPARAAEASATAAAAQATPAAATSGPAASTAAAPPAAGPPVAVTAAAPLPATSTPLVAPSGAAVSPSAGRDEVVPFTNIRRRTAEHMVRSKATSPHALVVLEADYERVERVRRAVRERFIAEEGFSLTYLPFVARAATQALKEWPHLNASVGDDALVVHHQVNLGIAVDLDHQGLIVPVVHRAEELGLRGMARRIHDLAERARSKRLSADDIAGGTFSITNAGPYGTLLTYPIINQPQVAILSTDGVRRRPVVVPTPEGGEAIAIHSVGLLGLAFDHRAVDGAYAAAFLRRVVELLAIHDWAAEL
jgi:pyruvate dehydrogenase E2 component (dihydrolipoamide acetyltransferase)